MGPTASGIIPPIMQERLLQMGEWLGTNGEAVRELLERQRRRKRENRCLFTDLREQALAGGQGQPQQWHLLHRLLQRRRGHLCHIPGVAGERNLRSDRVGVFQIWCLQHFWNFCLSLLPFSAFGSDLYYRIQVTSLTTSAFPWPPPPSGVDIISGR